jgi:hypothetical protein
VPYLTCGSFFLLWVMWLRTKWPAARNCKGKTNCVRVCGAACACVCVRLCTGKGRHEGELAGHDGGANGLSERAGVGAGVGQVGALHAHDVQTRRLNRHTTEVRLGFPPPPDPLIVL